MFDAKTAKRVSEEFGHLKDVVYLNTALTSVVPSCVRQAYADEMDEFITSYGSESKWHEENAMARSGIAQLIGADADEIALSNNTTTGIGAIAMGYPWDKEKNVVFEYDEPHHFIKKTWELKKRDIARMERIKKELGCTFLRYDERKSVLKEA